MSNQRRLLVHLSCELNSSCSAPCSVWFYYSVFYYLLVFIVFLCLLKMINELVILACDRRYKFSTYLHWTHSCTLHTLHTCNSTLAIRIFFYLRSSSMVFHHHLDIQCLIGTSFLSVITLVLDMFLISEMILSLFSSPHLGCHEFNNAISAFGSFFWNLRCFIYTWQSTFNYSLFIEFILNTLQLFKFNKKTVFLLSMKMFFFLNENLYSQQKIFLYSIKKKTFFLPSWNELRHHIRFAVM